jgi:hypothetical protein
LILHSDPLATVTDELKSWFDEDPSQTGREVTIPLDMARVSPRADLKSVALSMKI